MRGLPLLLLAAHFWGGPLRAAEPVSEPPPETDIPLAEQLFGDSPRAISGNPVAESDMPGTGLAGRLLHFPADNGLRLGELGVSVHMLSLGRERNGKMPKGERSELCRIVP